MSKRRAATLIELLVTVLIIALLLMAALPAYNKSRRTQELRSAALSVADIIERTQQYADSPRREGEGVAGYCYSFNPIGGQWSIKEEKLLSSAITSACNSGVTVETGQLPQYINIICETCSAEFKSNSGTLVTGKSLEYRVQHKSTGESKAIIVAPNGVINVE